MTMPPFHLAIRAALALLLCLPQALPAAGLKEATVTRAFNIVEILEGSGGAEPAEIGDEIRGRTAVRTGRRSRAELTFDDQSIARLGATTIFSFEEGTRDMTLENGVILLQVPKDAGGAKVRTAAVSAAITGTTVFVEFSMVNGTAVMKFIVVEGTVRLTMNGRPGESILLEAGQMITLPASATRFPDPDFVDLERLLATSGLMNPSQFAALGNQEQILQALREQNVRKNEGVLIELNYGIQGDVNIPTLSTAEIAAQAQAARVNAQNPPSAINPKPPMPPAMQAPTPPPSVTTPPKVTPPPPPPAPRPMPKVDKPRMDKPKPPPTPFPTPPKKKKMPEYPEYPPMYEN